MTDSDRSELFAALADLARRHPQWRPGQLLANVAGWADAEVWDVEDGQLLANVAGWADAEVWDVEDGQLLAAARAHLDQMDERHAAPALSPARPSLTRPA